MEGWYFRVTLEGKGQSFAWMHSIEDPDNPNSNVRGAATQVMGPGDTYLCYHTKDTSTFWGAEHALELGAAYEGPMKRPDDILSAERFRQLVGISQGPSGSKRAMGFQASPTLNMGRVERREEGVRPGPESSVGVCEWEFEVEPLIGYGNKDGPQRSTAGWLASFPVFEPHWQVLCAHGLANGRVRWGDQEYTFERAPYYAEKNWGESFPERWFWVQCNSLDSDQEVALTSAGARRAVPGGITEDVAMVGLHLNGHLYEFAPWKGTVSWSVDPWGRWEVWADGEEYAIEVSAACTEEDGTTLRAPSASQGLVSSCRDTFAGAVSVTLKRKMRGGMNEVVYQGTSDSCALEVGGGPWWTPYEAEAKMTEPLRSMLTAPVDLDEVFLSLPESLQPPGL